MKSLNYLLVSLISITIIWSCANEIVLTGGDKDLIPPMVDTSASTPNYQLRFFPEEIVLEFDEFINLRNPSKNISISPPLTNGMDVNHRGKKITIKFDEDEVLKEALKGKVIDAFTKKPVQDMTVMLYDNIADSVVFTEKPFYYVNTDKDGFYQFNNLRSDTFKIVGLKDLNLNYLYEENAEFFAFSDELVIIDTNELDVELLAFQAEAPAKFIEGKMVHDGLANLQFDQDLDTIPLTFLSNANHYLEINNPYVSAYIQDIDLFPLKFEIRSDTLIDTISIRKPQTKDRKVLPDFKLKKSNVNLDYGLHPDDTLEIEFTFPLDSLSYDILNMSSEEIFIDSLNRKILKVVDNWEEGGDYSLSLDSSAVWDFYGRTLDSTGIDFEVGSSNLYGSMDITFENAGKDNYIISIMNSESETIATFIVTRVNITETLESLTPSNYSSTRYTT